MMEEQIKRAAKLVWDYHRMGHELAPADAIFVLGSHDLRVAERAAELYLQGLSPRVILSGGLGNLTAGIWEAPESDRFTEVVLARGVPESALLIENRSTNTGENVQFTRQLLAERGLVIQSVIAVQKPYMERRTYATIRRQWPEVAVKVTSPQLDFDDYCSGEISREDVIHIMVGDLQRIMEYPRLGYMIDQSVPAQVEAAFDCLVSSGFTRHLLHDLPSGRPAESGFPQTEPSGGAES